MKESLWIMILLLCLSNHCADAATRRFEFNIVRINITKLCQTKSIVTVNGQYPGPTIRIQQGDNVVVRVNNLIDNNITIHWHGVNQHLTVWSDGPAYITQCPIQRNQSFSYRFNVQQVGTLFWHAHNSFLRGTVYGAFVIDPPRSKQPPYPYPVPYKEETIILGDWYVTDLDEEERNITLYGGALRPSDSYTINGRVGPYNCSGITRTDDTHEIGFVPGKTHLLRVINAALEQNLFFSIANHTMTVVEIDAAYTKPLTVTEFMITPGQTVSVLVTADAVCGRYYMAATPWNRGAPFNPQPALGIVNYISPATDPLSQPVLGTLPDPNNEALGESFEKTVRSLNSAEYPEIVPQTVDRSLYQVISLNLLPCAPGVQCQGLNGLRFAASMNNVSFATPSIAILQAYFSAIPGVFTTDFPDSPPIPYDYAGQGYPGPPFPTVGTKVSVIPYGANVQLVLQSTANPGANDSHPFHLHGFDFYIMGQGKGNFNAARDVPTFNLVDPPRRNTALLPALGWVALRFKAENPGVWLFHCHIEGHIIWGMEMAFIVLNGKGANETLPPPPRDLPRC